MIDTPQITRAVALQTAVIHLTIPRSEIQQVMGPAIEEVMDAVVAQGLTQAGPVFSHHLKMDLEIFHFEVGVPVSSPIQPTGRVQPGQLRSVNVARTVYCGVYEGLSSAWGELGQWIAEQKHTSAPDLWEFYVSGPETGLDPSHWKTELNQPLIES